MNAQLAETFKFAGMIGVITRPAIVATILFGVWRALGRANVSARARVSAWWWTVVFLAGWLVTVWVLAVRGAFASLSNGSAIAQVAFVPLVILILLGAALFAATRSADRRLGRRSTLLASWHSGLSSPGPGILAGLVTGIPAGILRFARRNRRRTCGRAGYPAGAWSSVGFAVRSSTRVGLEHFGNRRSGERSQYGRD
jgi:hypothetical protein